MSQDDETLTVADSTDLLDALFTTDDHTTTVSGCPSHNPIMTNSEDDHKYETISTVEVSSQYGSTGKSRILPSWLSGHNIMSQVCVRKKAKRKAHSSSPPKVFACAYIVMYLIVYFVYLIIMSSPEICQNSYSRSRYKSIMYDR